MRSSAGVGMTPPKVLATPKPASSVMISKTLGAPFGGTMRGLQQGFDWRASRWMTPPNGVGTGGNCCAVLTDVVPAGEHDSEAGCCANAPTAANVDNESAASAIRRTRAVLQDLVGPLLENATYLSAIIAKSANQLALTPNLDWYSVWNC